MQTTISSPVSCYGIGAHSGKPTQLTLKPAPANTGITFIRTDVSAVCNIIPATFDNVSETVMSTTIQNAAKISVSTIEHLMAALWGCGVDNVIVEVDGLEIPIMDGSSKPFVFLIECSGVRQLAHKRKKLRIMREVAVSHREAEIIAIPSKAFAINVGIEFASKAIGKQSMLCDEQTIFKDEIAGARTFGFVHELEYLRSKGLAQGSSLENAVGIEDDVILNQEGLRYSNEFARHKMLDALGDFYTTGAKMLGTVHCHKSGHQLNNEFLRKLFASSNNYCWV